MEDPNILAGSLCSAWKLNRLLQRSLLAFQAEEASMSKGMRMLQVRYIQNDKKFTLAENGGLGPDGKTNIKKLV